MSFVSGPVTKDTATPYGLYDMRQAYTAPRAAPRPPTRTSSRPSAASLFPDAYYLAPPIDFSRPAEPYDTSLVGNDSPPITTRSSSLLPSRATLPSVELPSRISTPGRMGELFRRRWIASEEGSTADARAPYLHIATHAPRVPSGLALHGPLEQPAESPLSPGNTHFGSSWQRQRRLQHVAPNASFLQSCPRLPSQVEFDFPSPTSPSLDTAPSSPGSVESQDIRTPTFEQPAYPTLPSKAHSGVRLPLAAATSAAPFTLAPAVSPLSVKFTACSERLASASFNTVDDLRRAMQDAQNMCEEAKVTRPSFSPSASSVDISSFSIASSVDSPPPSTSASSYKLKRKPVPVYQLPVSVKIAEIPPRPRVRVSSVDLGPPPAPAKKSLYGNVMGSLSMMDLRIRTPSRPPKAARDSPEPVRPTIAEWARAVGDQTKEERLTKSWTRVFRLKKSSA